MWRKEVYLHSLLSGWTFSNWKIIKRYTSKTYLLGQTSYLTKVVDSSEKVDLYHFKDTESYEKAQRTRGLSSANQTNFFWSYHKFWHKSWSNFIFLISIKHQFQNLNTTSASRLNLYFKILIKSSFKISRKIQLHDLYKTSATKYLPNSSFKFCLNFNFKIKSWPNVVLKVWTKI